MKRLTENTVEPVSREREKSNCQAQTGTLRNIIFPVQLITSRIDNHTRMIHTPLRVLTIPTVHNIL